MAKTVKITVNEHRYLHEIIHSEYGDNRHHFDQGTPEGDELAQAPVWSFSPSDNGGFGKSAGGIASSLVKKGLANVVSAYGWGSPDSPWATRRASDEDTIAITQLGIDTLREANEQFGSAPERKADQAYEAPAPAPAPAPKPKGTHPKHPRCPHCGRALYKSAKPATVKKSDPWAYCRNPECESNKHSKHRTLIADKAKALGVKFEGQEFNRLMDTYGLRTYYVAEAILKRYQEITRHPAGVVFFSDLG